MLDRRTAAGKSSLSSLAIFTALAVRNIQNQEQQGFVVMDTAQTDNRAHASIHLANPQTRPSLAREMREQLLNLMTMIPMQSTFNQG